MLKTLLLITTLITSLASQAQSEECSFRVLDGTPPESKMHFSYEREKEWTLDKLEDEVLVFGLYCEEERDQAMEQLAPLFEKHGSLKGMLRAGHTDTHEVNDIQVFADGKCYHIYFAFEVDFSEE